MGIDLLKRHTTITEANLPENFGEFMENHQNCSKYSPEEEEILNSIQLPDLITPIGDKTLDDHEKGDSYRDIENKHEHKLSITDEEEETRKDQKILENAKITHESIHFNKRSLSKQFSCSDSLVGYNALSYLIAAK